MSSGIFEDLRFLVAGRYRGTSQGTETAHMLQLTGLYSCFIQNHHTAQWVHHCRFERERPSLSPVPA
jgi:hypothetical protein